MTHSRAIDLEHGVAYVVTDLHGEWVPYQQYRDHFLHLYNQGEADYLIFLGDIIHGYGDEDDDYSVLMLRDIMQRQSDLGKDVVMMLLGNHELPHIYSVTLSKGDKLFTARFEHQLGLHRDEVVNFLKDLPFIIRTSGGTMLTHAGASSLAADEAVATRLLDFNHDQLLDEGSRLVAQDEAFDLVVRLLGLDEPQYNQMAWDFLAVENSDDPRYFDLLRGILVSNLAEWDSLWELLFTQCEKGLSISLYRRILSRFLQAFSNKDVPQRVLVTGHISVRDGVEIIADQQLRIGSWAHSQPPEAGRYLLFDVAEPVDSAQDLMPFVNRL